MAAGRIQANTAYPYSWNPNYPARIGIMPREGSNRDVRWFDVEPCYVFHPLNAYEDGESIVLDVVRHPKMFDTDLRGPNEGPPRLHRWTVDRSAGKVREQRLDDRGQEFPRMDKRISGKPHRYGYIQGFGNAGNSPNGAVLKHDFHCGETAVREFGKNREPGEFVFEPNSPDSPEDDGILMGFVYDKPDERSDLMLLDAGTLETIAAVHLPDRVPTGFHGNWIPSTL